jgi:hypothetical protein
MAPLSEQPGTRSRCGSSRRSSGWSLSPSRFAALSRGIAARQLVEQHAAAVAARLLEALADGELGFAFELATELDLQLARLVAHVEAGT